MPPRATLREPIVITGIGLVASLGNDRETVWRAVQSGQSRFRFLPGGRGIPENQFIGALVDLPPTKADRLKVLDLCETAAAEAIADAVLAPSSVDAEHFGCMISAHMGDTRWLDVQHGKLSPDEITSPPWWEQWLPNSSCELVARRYHCLGPRLSHSTACASSLISILSAVNAIRDGHCDIALAGGADTIDPLFVAGFHQMRVLATDEDPNRACRPFDRSRKGFVFGEGAAILVIERLGHALRRGASIYAEIAAIKGLAQAHHVTGIDAASDALSYLIDLALRHAELSPDEIGYINAHGTGTEQNDAAEASAINRSFGDAVRSVTVSSTKSILGHMINAAGAAELAITALALRDGFVPPTLNLHDPDPVCRFDCLPLVGRSSRVQHALKLSMAFGGHLIAAVLSRWNDAKSGFAYPEVRRAA